MKCSNEMIEYMHEYLDNEISVEHEGILRHHLQDCGDCQAHFHELKKAILFVQSTSNMVAPSGFTQKVMANLPKEKRKVGMTRWFKNHPLLTAASLFVVLMGSALLTHWKEDYQFSFSKQPELVVENDTVIVPAGKTVSGDVVVRNGNIKIEGEVDGNVTVINGDKYLASAGHVSGEIEEVDEIFEWLWYKIKDGTKQFMNMIKNPEDVQSSN
ncbi:zf-HC2 domain-containing protein [Bacillus massiliigorillae]|uniref:zf-HC2 domain-containing protein n=1 Tax=Bacillus massiliigorillae TaxID=1243664 RepID=UPI0003A91D1D|nr:zf-HC2 domain-containing protein [Bacillus massiliigorillae]